MDKLHCNICNKEFKNNKGISYHFKTIHNIDYIKYLIDNKLIEIPTCHECGKSIDILSGRGRTKILCHPEELIYCNNTCKLNSDEYKQKMSSVGKKNYKFLTNRNITDEERHKKSITTKNSWLNTDIRYKRIKSMKLYKNTIEHNTNISKSLKGIKRSDVYKDKMSKIISEKYINGEYSNHKIKYNSIKLHKTLNLMSSYEFKFSILLDLDPNVKTWKYQPLVLKNDILNKRYVPDFYYETSDGTKYLVEIDKYKGFKEKYGYKWKLELAEQYCNNNDINFKYIDLVDINNTWVTTFPSLNIFDIKLHPQVNNKFISMYLSELFTLSKIYIKLPIISKSNIKYKIPTENNTRSAVFGKSDTNFILQFYQNYWECKWKTSRFSPIDALNYRTTLNTILASIIKKNKPINGYSILYQLKNERYSISFFPPEWAEWIYSKYLNLNKFNNVLDICGGFGGRLLGLNNINNSISDFINSYTYIDANALSCDNTKVFAKNIKFNNVNIINDKFENIEWLKFTNFDLLFTSIPYYDLEIYNNINLNNMYGTQDQFILQFINSIFNLNSDIIILNISKKYSHIFDSVYINLGKYLLVDILSIEMSKHPFQKMSNMELFYVYRKNI